MKIAAAYIRVSTDDQLEYSPDSQLEKIREYAKSNDMILPEEFVFREDEGISGKKAEKRPEFMRMIGRSPNRSTSLSSGSSAASLATGRIVSYISPCSGSNAILTSYPLRSSWATIRCPLSSRP